MFGLPPSIFAAAAGGGKITFTDTFTGTDGDAPNARWTGDVAGWEINSNHLRFTGASFSSILTPCTPGNNTIDVDVDFSLAASTFAAIFISYIDASNCAFVQLNVGEVLTINSTVAGVNTVVATDTGHTRLTVAAAHWQVGIVGTLVTVTVTGGADPGTFSGSVGAGATGGSRVGLSMNTGKSADFIDNAALS